MHLSLKSKILVGLLCTATLSLCTSIVGVWNLFHLEERLRVVNTQYVPLLKILGQLESHQYFLEHDINDAIETQRSKLENFHTQIMQSKISSLSRLFTNDLVNTNNYFFEVERLKKYFSDFLLSVDKIFEPNASVVDRQQFSERKTTFKTQLKKMMRETEFEIRETSLSVQHEISRSVSMVVALLALFSIFSAGLVFWIDRLLKPLQKLTEIVKEISTRGLRTSDCELLQASHGGRDEISIFSHEFSRMASSLLDRNRELEAEQAKLEQAHRELGLQNVILKKTRTKLIHEEKLGLIGRLSAQMAHEIRNPLNALGLHLETLAFEQRQENNEAIHCMRMEIARLAEITESYLGLARAPKLEFSKIDINEIILEVLRLYRPLLNEKDIQVDVELTEAPELEVDRKHITLVLGNLIKNSIEALDLSTGSKKKIHIQSRLDNDRKQLFFEFADNGPGINGENFNSIFSPFFSTKANGTGLGLSHSKQIIDAHGGEIGFNAAAKQGIVFFITLPIQKEIFNA